MPVILNVTGPHQILWGASGGTPSTALGRADNDDLFNIDIEYQYNDVFTNELGANPADAILMGARAYVNFTLVTYDPDQLASLIQSLDGQSGTGFLFPKVGTLAYNGGTSSQLVALKVDSDISNAPHYTVDRCRLVSTSVKDVGNKPTRAGFKFEILPGTAGAAIYTRSTS
jgi:hypothetical protein